MKNLETDFNKYIAAVLGLVVGDALGVPAEFKSRTNMKDNPVTDMIGYGTHNQPAGTWSDDSSMVIATMEWLGEMKDNQPDYAQLMDKFSNWLMYGDYTPYGEIFDCGISTSRAIIDYGKGMEPLLCGGKAEWENGNGSLMRILPAALWCSKELAMEEMGGKEFIYDLSSLTHGHLRSKMGCLIYSKLIVDLLYVQNKDKMETVEKSISICKKYFDSVDDEEAASEKEKYTRLWDVSAFQNLEEDDIRSSGYVVDTLGATIWCFLNTDNYKECVLKAVNLGDDTDTVGAVAGGLAGIYYGIEAIPEKWISLLPKKEWIATLVEQMYRTNENLKAVIKNSMVSQKLILADDVVDYEVAGGRAGKVVVSGKRTLEASESYAKQGKRVCVLNFASATNPGGGVVHGSSAQEEAICRCSTLYPCLNTKEMWNKFYGPHREADSPLYNEDCIFTPAVKVFKSDINFPELIQEVDWWDVDVITCAAPNLRNVPSNRMNPNAGSKKADISYDELKALHTSRIRRIFEVAIANKAEVLILGAFGCGAFRNPPVLVAEVFAEFTEKYRGCFDVIEYAVYHTEREMANYVAFKDAMERFI